MRVVGLASVHQVPYFRTVVLVRSSTGTNDQVDRGARALVQWGIVGKGRTSHVNGGPPEFMFGTSSGLTVQMLRAWTEISQAV